MSPLVQNALLLIASTLGLTSALDCISCSWDAKNDTVDHACLSAPYKLGTLDSCPEPSSPGIRYACQTYAVFKTSGDDKALLSLKRNCGQKHSNCNNACLQGVDNCWMCCDDWDKCNSFPLRANLDLVSGAPSPWKQWSSGARPLAVVLLVNAAWAVLGGAYF